MSPLAVRHNQAASRFEAEINGALALAEYSFDGNRMIFTRTEVPPPLRGGGIAAQLVRSALEEAGREGRRVVPACSYVARFIERHQEFASLVDRGE